MNNSKFHKKQGFIHIFFMGAVVILLMVLLSLTSQAMDQKVYRAKLETMLKLDYAGEGYYLLIREGEMVVEEGISYGNLSLEGLSENRTSDPYIQVERQNHHITISSWFKGERRGSYEVENEESIDDD